MQATFVVSNEDGENMIIRNMTPFHVDPQWLESMVGVLTEEEINQQIENRLTDEFMLVLPIFRQHMREIHERVAEMDDPQAGEPKKLPTLKKYEFNNIPSRRFHKTDKDTNFKQDTCVICTDAFKSNNKIPVLQCGHDFHWKCLEQWVTKSHNVCPICKQEISKEDQ